MSLRQECVDMINSIMQPLSKRDDLYEYRKNKGDMGN